MPHLEVGPRFKVPCRGRVTEFPPKVVWPCGVGHVEPSVCVSTVEPFGHVGSSGRVASSSLVASSGRVGPFGHIELCDCVSTSGSSGCVGSSSGHVGSFGHVGPCRSVGPFGLVGPIGRVGPSGHVGQSGRIGMSGLVRLFVLDPTLKGWFGYLVACVRTGLSRLHGRSLFLIGSLNHNRFPII